MFKYVQYHAKMCLRVYAESGRLDQPVHSHSVIRAFAVSYQQRILMNVLMASKARIRLCASAGSCDITKTCLYNFDSLKPHFYIVKLGFTGVYIIFLISAQNIDCGYSLEPPRRSMF